MMSSAGRWIEFIVAFHARPLYIEPNLLGVADRWGAFAWVSRLRLILKATTMKLRTGSAKNLSGELFDQERACYVLGQYRKRFGDVHMM
jgi:hypothetical protein